MRSNRTTYHITPILPVYTYLDCKGLFILYHVINPGLARHLFSWFVVGFISNLFILSWSTTRFCMGTSQTYGIIKLEEVVGILHDMKRLREDDGD
jgi:hypothetical protein